jgi:hypothetical protein
LKLKEHIRILTDTKDLGEAGELKVEGLEPLRVETDSTPTFAEQTAASAEMTMLADFPGRLDDVITKIKISGNVIGQATGRLKFTNSKAPEIQLRPSCLVLRPEETHQFKVEFRGNAKRVSWKVDSGTIEVLGSSNEILVYKAPKSLGSYQVRVSLESDPTMVAYATVLVEQAELDATINTANSVEINTTNAASVKAYESATYNWVLDGGDILSGQGSPNILYQVGDKVSCRLHCTITTTTSSATGLANIAVIYRGLVVETLDKITTALDPIAVDRNGDVFFALGTEGTLEQLTNGQVKALHADDVKDSIVDGAIQGSSSSIMAESNGDLWVDGDLEYLVHRLTPQGILEPLHGEVTKSSILDPDDNVPYLGTPVAGCCNDSLHFFYDSGIVSTLDEQGTISYLAGQANSYGLVDGFGFEARFGANPWGSIISEDEQSIWLVDTDNDAIRNISFQGQVTTLTGGSGYQDGLLSEAKFQKPSGICLGWIANQLLIADTANKCIRSYQNGSIYTLTGSPLRKGLADGPIHLATLTKPVGITFNNGYCYFTDSGRIRRITTGTVQLQEPYPAPQTQIVTAPKGVVGNLYAAQVPIQDGTFKWEVVGGTLEAGQGSHLISYTAIAPGSLVLKVLVTNLDGYSLQGQKVVPID